MVTHNKASKKNSKYPLSIDAILHFSKYALSLFHKYRCFVYYYFVLACWCLMYSSTKIFCNCYNYCRILDFLIFCMKEIRIVEVLTEAQIIIKFY